MDIHLSAFDSSAKTALGSTWTQSWEGLARGQQSLCSGQDRFPDWPDATPIACFDQTILPDQLHARAPRLARLLGEAAREPHQRLQEANPGIQTGVVIATSHGDSHAASETSEALSRHSSIDAETATSIVQDTLYTAFIEGLQSFLPGMTISAACASAGIGLGLAASRIREGALDACFLVSLDVQSRIAHAGFRQLGAMAAGGCKPFDRDRDGTTIGEAGAFMLLSRADVVAPADRRRAVRLAGFGQSCDARHSVEPSVEGLHAAIAKALAQAGVRAEDIAAVFWHGTGTLQNDRTEAEVARLLFGDRTPPGTSVKGAFGHTMGASAALSVLAATEALFLGTLPPTVGLAVPAFEHLRIVQDGPQAIAPGPVLVVALGFGGINAALVLDRVGA